jgi:2'-5' RNA ligase
MLYVLTYPEFETLKAMEIDRFRSAHEPERAILVPPHITLVYGLRHANTQDIISLCEVAAENLPELTIEFADSEVAYDPFEDTHKLFLICKTGRDALITLHDQLYNGPHRAELNSTIPYFPHMTVATNADRTLITQLDVAEIGAFPIEGIVKSLEVVEFVDGKLNTLESVSLSR